MGAKRLSGRAIYLGTILAIVAMASGFVAASVAITSSSQNAEANYVGAAAPVTGLTYGATVLTSVTGSPSASTGTAAAPQTLVAGTNAFCATTCTNGHVSENVTYAFTTNLAGAIQISLNVIAGSTTTVTVYLAQASTPVSGSIYLVVDLGSASTTITSVTVTAQQCSGATCP